jgi:uncharacterized surface protein with fasciclin (FAS1) repeats
MMHVKKYLKYYSGWLLLIAVVLLSCKKEYYRDSGLQKGVYPISSYEFLQTQPFFFDTLVQVIRLAGLENELRDSTVTFYAPTDHAIQKAMNFIHAIRYDDFKDTLRLDEVPGEVWRKYLSRYIIHDKYMLKDILRYDPLQKKLYGGMNIESLDGYIMHQGVVFSDYNGTKDVGPRTLKFSMIGDLSQPFWWESTVATSDLQTKNGIVHVLDDNHFFGFQSGDFVTTVLEYIK